jgi:hypothetical protein
MKGPSSAGDWLAIALVGLASASVIAGFVIIGGPGKARQVQQDDARLRALTQTAEGLNCYARGAGALPGDMTDVRAAIEDPGSPARLAEGCSNASWADDPITGEAFEVVPVDATKAQICAVFARPAAGYDAYMGDQYVDSATARPEAGRFCYTVNLTASPNGPA